MSNARFKPSLRLRAASIRDALQRVRRALSVVILTGLSAIAFSRFYASPFCGPSRAMLLNWPYALGVMLALAAILSLAFWVARRLVCRVRTRALAAG
jgi:hypothetical protein